MPESLLSFFLSDAEQQQEGQCALWFFSYSQRAPSDVVPISFLVSFALFSRWDHGAAFWQVL